MNSSISSSDPRGFDGRFLLRMTLAAGLVGFLFLLWSEVFLRTKVIAVSPYYQQQQVFQTAQSIPAVLIGDSHTSQDVVASPDILNFGLAGENIQQMHSKARFVLVAHPELRAVILQASPHMFAEYRYTEKGRRDYDQLLGRTPLSYLWSDSYLRDRIGWYLKKFITKGSLSLPGTFTPYGSLLSDYEMKEPVSVKAERVVVARVKTHLVKRPLEHSAHFQAYRDMLTELRSRNIAVCMVEYPVTPIHRRIVAEMAPEYPAIRRQFEALALEFGATYKSYWSAIDDYRLYRNADHLNRHGAAALTPVLMADCGIGPQRQAAVAHQ